MKTVRVHLDAHVHAYPWHDVSALFRTALDRMPRKTPTDLHVVALAERADCSFFQALAQDEFPLPADRWQILAWDPDGAVKVRHLPDQRNLWIMAGRQMAAAGRVEVSSLGSDVPVPDGQSAADTIRAILDAGGLPALNWAPGKWLFQRGKLIRQLCATFPPSQLVLIDTSLRCRGWPAPRLYARERQKGRAILAGSDPLPATGEESSAGAYYASFSIPALDDHARLVAPLKAALTSGNLAITYGGRRDSPLRLLRRLRRHQPSPAGFSSRPS